LGARKRFVPISTEGRVVIFRKGITWCQPPFLHEQTLASAWVRSVEEMAQGGILNQHPRDVSTLFLWISSESWEPMMVEDLEKRTVQPPLLSDEGRRLMFLQAGQLLDISSLGKEDQGQTITEMLEDDLEILRQAGIFRLSERELNLVKENIEKELQRGVA